jgi:hypothetical protein
MSAATATAAITSATQPSTQSRLPARVANEPMKASTST